MCTMDAKAGHKECFAALESGDKKACCADKEELALATNELLNTEVTEAIEAAVQTSK
jgi:hypothetical protein